MQINGDLQSLLSQLFVLHLLSGSRAAHQVGAVCRTARGNSASRSQMGHVAVLPSARGQPAGAPQTRPSPKGKATLWIAPLLSQHGQVGQGPAPAARQKQQLLSPLLQEAEEAEHWELSAQLTISCPSCPPSPPITVPRPEQPGLQMAPPPHEPLPWAQRGAAGGRQQMEGPQREPHGQRPPPTPHTGAKVAIPLSPRAAGVCLSEHRDEPGCSSPSPEVGGAEPGSRCPAAFKANTQR